MEGTATPPQVRRNQACCPQLTQQTAVGPVAALPQVAELNIGHFIIGEAIFQGLGPAILEMRRQMDEARA